MKPLRTGLEYGTQRQLFIQGLLLYWEISKWVVQKCGSTGIMTKRATHFVSP